MRPGARSRTPSSATTADVATPNPWKGGRQNATGSQTTLLATGINYVVTASCTCSHNVTLTSSFGESAGPSPEPMIEKTFQGMSTAENDTWVKATCQHSGQECLVEFTVLDMFFNPWEERVPPGKETSIIAWFSHCLALTGGREVELTSKTVPGTSGTVTGLDPDAMTETDTIVSFTGGEQTSVGGGKNIQLQAAVSYDILAATSDFSVCAHPCGFSTRRDGDINDGVHVGVRVEMRWGSDSDDPGDLDQAEIRERVLEHQRDNPPYKGAIPEETSDYGPAKLPPGGKLLDSHGYARSQMDVLLLEIGKTYTATAKQLFQFRCKRCGVEHQPCGQSGYHIIHRINWDAGWMEWAHRCAKEGQHVTIDGGATGPGTGRADSNLHLIYE